MPIRDEAIRKRNRELLRELNASDYERETIIARERAMLGVEIQRIVYIDVFSNLIMDVIFIFREIFMRIPIVSSWIQGTSILERMLS